MAHGDAREGKWRGNWQMEWVASTLHTTSKHGVSSITTADGHTSAASSRLNWCPPDWNELVRFAKRRNMVSAHVPSNFSRPLPGPVSLCRNWCHVSVGRRWQLASCWHLVQNAYQLHAIKVCNQKEITGPHTASHTCFGPCG